MIQESHSGYITCEAQCKIKMQDIPLVNGLAFFIWKSELQRKGEAETCSINGFIYQMAITTGDGPGQSQKLVLGFPHR